MASEPSKHESMAATVLRGTAQDVGLHEVSVFICDPCLDGKGGVCHTPGCLLIRCTGPDIPIRSRIEEEADDLRIARDQAVAAIVRLGHSEHCACRLAWGDGECECGGPTLSSDVTYPGAVASERARVVAFLRALGDRARTTMQGNPRPYEDMADAIERGEHEEMPYAR